MSPGATACVVRFYSPRRSGVISATLDGTDELRRKSYNLAVHMPAPAYAVIRAQWQELGGSWQGELRAALCRPRCRRKRRSRAGAATRGVLRDMDKWSNNVVMARLVFISVNTARPLRTDIWLRCRCPG